MLFTTNIMTIKWLPKIFQLTAQRQVFVTNKSIWDFVVSTHVDMKVVMVDYDSEYFEESLNPKVMLFYDNYRVKYAVSRRNGVKVLRYTT